MNIKTLVLGVLLIIILGVGGLLYRNAVEHPNQPIACPMDAKLCPDGTAVGRTGLSCTFPACPPPNVSLDAIGLAFALPVGFTPIQTIDAAEAAVVVAYEKSGEAGTGPSGIVIRRYAIEASSTALATIEATAIGATSGESVPATTYSSLSLGQHRFTVVVIERFEGVVDVAYYLARGNDVLRFDAIDRDAVDRKSVV